MSDNIYTRYFVFSKTQMENLIEIQKKRGGIAPKFGQVMVRGVARIYTDIVTSPNNTKFADSIVITSGDIRTIKYTTSNIK